jgi:alanine dehydrogenase
LSTKVRIISEAQVAATMSLDDVIELIERAFAADAGGDHRNFPVVRERLAPAHDGIFGIKSGIAGHILGFKAGGFWPGNRARGLLPHQSTMLLFDPDSGQPAALVSANRITGLRTGAAGSVAAKYLARTNATSATVIGCGAQGRMQLRALARVRNLRRATVWDRDEEAAIAFAGELGAELGLEIAIATSAEDAIRGSDIVVTATPGERPVVEAAWIAFGTHITAIGADTAGKQELETDLLLKGKLVVDNRAQALTLGESQHLGSLINDPGAAIYAELGEIVGGRLAGRTSDEEITIFDATGVTFEDLVVADEVFRRCEARNLGAVVEL